MTNQNNISAPAYVIPPTQAESTRVIWYSTENIHINEEYWSQTLREYLNAGNSTLSPQITQKLQLARQRALLKASVTQSSSRFIAALKEIFFTDESPFNLSTLLVIFSLSLVVLGSGLWNLSQRESDLAEIDSQILTDDLPPSAYADPGFQSWLQQPVQADSNSEER